MSRRESVWFAAGHLWLAFELGRWWQSRVDRRALEQGLAGR